MIGKLVRVGVVSWLASKAYQQVAKAQARSDSSAGNAAASAPAAGDIVKHMEVVGSDGLHVGTVDHLALKLTRSDAAAGGRHHVLAWEHVAAVRNGKVVLDVTANEGIRQQTALAE